LIINLTLVSADEFQIPVLRQAAERCRQPCRTHKIAYTDHNQMRTILTIFIFLISSVTVFSQLIYKFEIAADVYGCSNVSLQKISKNRQYELRIEINKIDSLPISKEFDLAKYSNYVTVYLNKYQKGNKDIRHICNDILIINNKVYKPEKFVAKSGKLFISQWNSKDFIVSLSLKNTILKDKLGKQIQLPFEQFSQLTVGWIGG